MFAEFQPIGAIFLWCLPFRSHRHKLIGIVVSVYVHGGTPILLWVQTTSRSGLFAGVFPIRTRQKDVRRGLVANERPVYGSGYAM